MESYLPLHNSNFLNTFESFINSIFYKLHSVTKYIYNILKNNSFLFHEIYR